MGINGTRSVTVDVAVGLFPYRRATVDHCHSGTRNVQLPQLSRQPRSKGLGNLLSELRLALSRRWRAAGRVSPEYGASDQHVHKEILNARQSHWSCLFDVVLCVMDGPRWTHQAESRPYPLIKGRSHAT